MNSSMALKMTAAVLLAAAPGVVRAAAPAILPVQGYLTDSGGAPINGSVNAQIKLYDAPMGGAILFNDTFSIVVSEGVFTVYLGSNITLLDLGIFEGFDNVYIGIQVGNDPEMTPRIQIGTAPYAAYSNMCGDSATLNGVPGTGYSLSTHTHPAPDWGTITGIPAGFSDGTDADTTYSAGAGLQLTGTAFSVNGVTSAMITDGTVDTNDLANLAVGTAKIQANAVTLAKVANDAVDSSKIVDGTIAAADIAAGAITAGKLGLGAIVSADIADGTIVAADLAAGAVDSSKIFDGTIATGDIANNAITTAKIATNAITSNEIAADTIAAGDIATDAVGSAEIAADAVGTAELAAGAVTGAKIAAGAVTSAEIAADTIVAADLAPDSVGSSELANNSVNTGEIIDLAVTTAKHADLSVTTGKIADLAITTAKITDLNVTTGKIADLGVTTAKLADASVTAPKLGVGAVTARELALSMGTGSNGTNVDFVTSPVESWAVTNFSPQDTGTCFLMISGAIQDSTSNPTATDFAYLRASMRNLTTMGVSIGSAIGYYGPYQDALAFASLGQTFSVTAGTNYDFGCRVYFSAGYTGADIASCTATYFCQ